MSRKSQLALAASVASAIAAGSATAAKRRIRAQRQAADAEPVSLSAPGPSDRAYDVEAQDGVRLHVEELGPRDAPCTVVFIHGWVCTQQLWVYQRRELPADDLRLVFYDQRGHGQSGRPRPENTGLDFLAKDLVRVIEAAGPVGQVVLVGHSMGGMAVMALAEAHPEMFGPGGVVAGVALLSTSSGRLASVTLGLPVALTRVTKRLLPRSYTALMRFGDRIDAILPRSGDLTWMLSKYLGFGADVPPALVELMESMVAQTPLATAAGFANALLGHDKLAALPVLTATPTLILVGGADLLTPVDHSVAMAQSLPSADLVVLPGCGHLVMLEQPQLTNLHLRALIDRARAKSRAATDDRMSR